MRFRQTTGFSPARPCNSRCGKRATVYVKTNKSNSYNTNNDQFKRCATSHTRIENGDTTQILQKQTDLNVGNMDIQASKGDISNAHDFRGHISAGVRKNTLEKRTFSSLVDIEDSNGIVNDQPQKPAKKSKARNETQKSHSSNKGARTAAKKEEGIIAVHMVTHKKIQNGECKPVKRLNRGWNAIYVLWDKQSRHVLGLVLQWMEDALYLVVELEYLNNKERYKELMPAKEFSDVEKVRHRKPWYRIKKEVTCQSQDDATGMLGDWFRTNANTSSCQGKEDVRKLYKKSYDSYKAGCAEQDTFRPGLMYYHAPARVDTDRAVYPHNDTSVTGAKIKTFQRPDGTAITILIDKHGTWAMCPGTEAAQPPQFPPIHIPPPTHYPPSEYHLPVNHHPHTTSSFP
eukprot:m.95871 g.95871  ORF g.95871 m.95871 type:complete len:401 (+) comp10128_c0_seq2:409-1611(+)